MEKTSQGGEYLVWRNFYRNFDTNDIFGIYVTQLISLENIG